MSLISCYPKIQVEGFDQSDWKNPLTCDHNRMELAQLLIENQDEILGKGQAEIKSLLGQPEEHELYNRNQKFFLL